MSQMSGSEPEGLTAVQSQMIAALTEKISLVKHFTKPDLGSEQFQEDVVAERYRVYLQCLEELAGNSYEAVDELANFAAYLMVIWAVQVERDPHDMLQGIARSWHPGPAPR